jgi:hypothetical protein
MTSGSGVVAAVVEVVEVVSDLPKIEAISMM